MDIDDPWAVKAEQYKPWGPHVWRQIVIASRSVEIFFKLRMLSHAMHDLVMDKATNVHLEYHMSFERRTVEGEDEDGEVKKITSYICETNENNNSKFLMLHSNYVRPTMVRYHGGEYRFRATNHSLHGVTMCFDYHKFGRIMRTIEVGATREKMRVREYAPKTTRLMHIVEFEIDPFDVSDSYVCALRMRSSDVRRFLQRVCPNLRKPRQMEKFVKHINENHSPHTWFAAYLQYLFIWVVNEERAMITITCYRRSGFDDLWELEDAQVPLSRNLNYY